MDNDINNAYPNFSPMNQDGRYMAVKEFVETGKISTFEEIFPTHFPKTKLAKDLGKHGERMDDFIRRVDIMNVKTLDKIADIYDLDPVLVFKIVHAQYVQKIKKAPTRRKNK